MNIKEISIEEFKNFASTHFIGNFHQSINYALLKAEEDYEYEFIGYGNEELVGASLVVYKRIGNFYYGYAPRGFLIDYSNLVLLEDFTKRIKEYYLNRNFAFIKINPEIAIGKLQNKQGDYEYNNNYKIIDNLVKCGYKRLKSNMNFEAALPRINAIVNLESFDAMNLTKNTRNKVRKGIRKGLHLEVASQDKLHIFYNFVKDKTSRDKYYFEDLYNVFSKSNDIDLLLVKIDYKEFLINAQNNYNYEYFRNNELNNKLISSNNSNIINAKMNSDKALLSYKNDIAEASKYLNENVETYVAGALVIKHQNRITIQMSGFDRNFARFAPNYFLYYALLHHYKDTFKYADLNGMTADLSYDNQYYGLNRFKLGFKPNVYEYIGEFDLIINEDGYNHLLKTGLLAKEFNK